jgi:predicted nucleic acid-binding protein
MSAEQACREIISTRTVFEMLPETAQTYIIWENLVAKHKIVGKRAHDVRLVAVAIENKIPKLLTFDDSDFRSFTEIEAVNPFDVLVIPRH